MAGPLVGPMTLYAQFRPAFSEVTDSRTYPIEWLDAEVWSGKAQVWGADDACLVTTVKTFPTGAFEVHVLVAAGDMGRLVNETIKQVEEWAQDIGALFVTIASKQAWARIMAPHGYAHWQTELRKEV